MRKLLFFFTLFFASFVYAEKKSLQAPLFEKLSSFNHTITTKNPLAQRFFNQGLVFYYGFEWSESIRSFREATRLDPNCGMCYWGLALALGSKANAPMTGNEYTDAQKAIQKALSLKAKETPIEQAYVKALALRFQHKPNEKNTATLFNCHMSGQWNTSNEQELLAYANAMKEVAKQNPQDNDAKALYAYSLFDVTRWRFWDKDGKMNQYAPIATETLKTILAADSSHVGANHYFVHLIEMSPQPAEGLASAERLKTLVPLSEHLVHMPTHIYFLIGRYHEATDSNLKAIAAYKTYSKLCLAQGFKPEITYLYHHNFDFLRSTAAMEGRKQLALSAIRELKENFPSAWIKQDASLQGFIAIPYYVKARFGMWNEILKEPMPNANYQFALGMWHYTRGMAFIYLDNLKNAKKQLTQLQNIIKAKHSTEASYLGENGQSLLKIAQEVLSAKLADANNDEKNTFTHLKTAQKIQHDMGYHEPPDWYFPLSEALGYAYLKWNHPKEAIVYFQENLKQYPNNGWGLFGLAKSYRKLGDIQKAEEVEKQFKTVWQYADVPEPILMF